MTYDVGNPGPGLGQSQKCVGVKSVNGNSTPPPPLDNGISNTDIKKKKKNLHKKTTHRFHSKKLYSILSQK